MSQLLPFIIPNSECLISNFNCIEFKILKLMVIYIPIITYSDIIYFS